MTDRIVVAPPLGARPVSDADAIGLIELIGGIYAEYPGCVLDLEGVDDDLIAPGTVVQQRGSPWWVVDAPTGGGLAASVGAGPMREGTVELKRLYVARHHRGQGLATALVSHVEQHALQLGATTLELWSDSRFKVAHRLYGRLGFTRTDEERELGDPSETTEWRFVRMLPA